MHLPAALVCFRDGVVTARTPAYAFSDGVDLHEEDVTTWLLRAGVLHAAGGGVVGDAGRGRGGEADASEVRWFSNVPMRMTSKENIMQPLPLFCCLLFSLEHF